MDGLLILKPLNFAKVIGFAFECLKFKIGDLSLADLTHSDFASLVDPL